MNVEKNIGVGKMELFETEKRTREIAERYGSIHEFFNKEAGKKK